MAISDTQKVDYLWKKIGYAATKTDTTANKDATNEALPSPLQIRGDSLLVQSSSIPSSIPATTTSIVTVYRPDATLEMPQTAIGTNGPGQRGQLGSATAYRTWQTGSQNWISPEFGATYSVRVFLDDAGRTTSNTTGTELFATASGEEWFFDYQSGVLNFSGTNLPSGISTKSVYISGARYTGEIGIANTVNTAAAAFAHANAAFAAANTGTSAVAAFNQANSAFFHANAAFTAANNATDTYVRNHANAAFDAANAATATDTTQNNSITAAFFHANASFSRANNSVQSTGLTNTRIPYANATGFLQDSSSLIWDNANQVLKPGAGGAEIGGDSGYGYVSAQKLYATGITSGRVVYVGASGLLVGNSNFAFTGTQLNITGNVSANNIVANGVNLFDYTNAAFSAANAATSGNATDGWSRNQANAAFDTANGAVAVNTTQNNSITVALDTANAAYSNANSYITYNEAVNVTQNNSIIAAFAAANAATATDVTQNNSIASSFVHANAAFTRANNSLNANTGGQITGDVIVIGNVSANIVSTTGSNGIISGANAIFANYVYAANGNVDLYIYATKAFDVANAATGGSAADSFARNQANASFTAANGAVAVNLTQNNSIDSAFIHANAAFLAANNATDTFVRNHANAAFDTANGAVAVNLTQNNSITVALNTANAAFSNANSYITYNEAVNVTQNNSIAAAFLAANAATATDATQNNSITVALDTANAAFAAANAATGGSAADSFARNQANAAFIRANNSLDANSGGTISGDVVINANLTVTGNTTYVNTINQLIGDNIITLNADLGQVSQPTQDAGFEIERGIQPNSSFLWIESTGKWAANNGNTSIYVASEATLTAAYDTANAAFDAANAATATDATQNNSISAAFVHANAAFASANNIDGVNTTQNNSIASAFIHANAAFANANSYITYNEAVNVTQNNSIAAVFLQSNNNVGVDLTQNNSIAAAFTRANNSLNANTGGTVNGDVIFVGNVTSNTLTTTGSNGSITGANAIFANYIFAANSNVDLYIYATRAFETANAATGGSAADSFARNQANGAFTAANGAVAVNLTQNNSIAAVFIHANAAFANANSYITYNEAVSVTQNNSIASAFIHANAAFASANNIDGVNVTQNNSIIAAFDAANAATATDTTQNNSIIAAFYHANAAFANANSYITYNEAVSITQNNSIAASFIHANAAFANSNTYITYAEAVSVTQNNSITAAFLAANAATATDATQNNSITAAFIRANNSLDANNGGTISGDIVITGNLTANIVGGTF
jgi:hypothetical protein